MSELPKAWGTLPLDIAATLIRGVSYKKNESSSEFNEGLLPILRANNIQDGKLYFDDLVYIPADKIKVEQKIKANDIVIAMSSGSKKLVGKSGIATVDFDGGFGTFCGLLRPKKHLDARYIGHFTRSKYYADLVSSLSKGVNINNLKPAHFSEIMVPLAPLNEQIRIANKLDSILAKVDKAQARLDKIPAILKRFRQSVLAAATSGELTKEWRGNKGIDTWTFPKIKEVGKVQLGRQRSPKYHSGENMKPYLRVQNVFENLIDISDVMEMDFSETDFQRYQLHDGDILLNEGQSPKFLGRPAIYRDELEGACFTNTLIRFQANELTTPEFALIVFRNHMHSGRYIEEGAITTNLAHLGAGRFSNVEFPLPPISEQAQIVQSAERMLSKANKVEKQYLDAKTRLDRLTQSILAKAFRGELVPQDPTDESAEQLLERIFKEREQVTPKKTTRKRTTKAKTAEKG